MTTADEVRARIRGKRQELVELIGIIPADELAAPRPDGGWAIKDHLVHIAAWEHWLLALFEGRDKLEAMGAKGAGKTVDEINDVIWERHKGDSVEQALGYFNEAHDQLMAVLGTQTTEDFARPYRTFFEGSEGSSNEQPVLVAVAGNTYDHYDEHIGWLKQMRVKPAPS